MTDAPSFPDDENGVVLRRMSQNRDDLAQPRNVEFQHVFAQKPDALEFLAAASDELSTVSIYWFRAPCLECPSRPLYRSES
jgi:hypothetical protein